MDKLTTSEINIKIIELNNIKNYLAYQCFKAIENEIKNIPIIQFRNIEADTTIRDNIKLNIEAVDRDINNLKEILLRRQAIEHDINNIKEKH